MIMKPKRLRSLSLIMLFAFGLLVLLVGCSTVTTSRSSGPVKTVQQTNTNSALNSAAATISTPPGSTSGLNITPSTTIPSVSPSPTSGASTLVAYFLDVGQGDSEILMSGGSSILVDAGTNASTSTLINDIKSLGISRFDVVIATHPHEDHIGGLDAVINQFSIGKLYMPKVSTTTKTFEDVLQAIKNKGLTVTTPVPGTSFSLGSATCTILAPNSPSYTDLNSYSIVMRVANGNNSFLFTGDAQTDSEKEMLSKGFTLKSDVLKVGHHGSSTSTSPDFLKAVSPKYAVIEVGKDNDYGHPHGVTLDKLAAAGVQIYRTDRLSSLQFGWLQFNREECEVIL
jgi:competence protein ComEC